MDYCEILRWNVLLEKAHPITYTKNLHLHQFCRSHNSFTSTNVQLIPNLYDYGFVRLLLFDFFCSISISKQLCRKNLRAVYIFLQKLTPKELCITPHAWHWPPILFWIIANQGAKLAGSSSIPRLEYACTFIMCFAKGESSNRVGLRNKTSWGDQENLKSWRLGGFACRRRS
jgi:hypothetical protein